MKGEFGNLEMVRLIFENSSNQLFKKTFQSIAKYFTAFLEDNEILGIIFF